MIFDKEEVMAALAGFIERHPLVIEYGGELFHQDAACIRLSGVRPVVAGANMQ